MGSRFDDDFAAVALPDLFWQFGESVEYLPAVGGSATLTVLWTEREDYEPEDHRADAVKLVDVTIGRDAASSYGYLLAPATGDTINRDGDVYQWTGRVVDKSPHAWVLEFRRRTQKLAGGRQTRQ